MTAVTAYFELLDLCKFFKNYIHYFIFLYLLIFNKKSVIPVISPYISRV